MRCDKALVSSNLSPYLPLEFNNTQPVTSRRQDWISWLILAAKEPDMHSQEYIYSNSFSFHLGIACSYLTSS